MFGFDYNLIPKILSYLRKYSRLSTNQLIEFTNMKLPSLNRRLGILESMNILGKKKVLMYGHYQNSYFLTEKGLKICNNKKFKDYLFNSLSYNIIENNILKILQEHRELTTGQLCDILNFPHNRIFKSLNKLEKKGFLEKNVKRGKKTSRAFWKLLEDKNENK